MASRLAIALSFATFVFAATAAPAAWGQQQPTASARATARALMDEGFEHRERGDLRGALEAFRAADALVRAPTTTLEVARVEEALGMLLEARNTLESMASPTSTSEPREFAEARAAAAHLSEDLDARVPSVRFALQGAARDGASIAIDGDAIPRAARDVAHRLDPGQHIVVVRTAAGSESRVTFSLHEGEARQLEVAVADVPAPVSPVVTTSPVAPSAPQAATPSATPVKRPPAVGSSPIAQNRTIAYVSFGIAATGLAVGTIAGLVAIAHKNDAATQCVAGECPPSTYHDLDVASGASTVSNVGFVVAGLGAVAGVVALLVERRPEPKAAGFLRPFAAPSSVGIGGSF
jgi:hypothetical protein